MTASEIKIIVSAQDIASGTIAAVKKNVASMGDSIRNMSEWVQNSMEKMQTSGGSWATWFLSSISGIVAAAASVGTAFKAINSAANFEQTSIAFQTMLGDVWQAQALLKQLSDFAAATPFEFPEIAAAGKQLLAFWVSANEIKGTLTTLGDIASGVSVPIGQLTNVFWQVKAAWHLMGQDLLQFTSAGIPILEALSTTLGKSSAEIKKMVEKWQVGFPDVQKALQSLTGEGGKFHDMMAKQSKSLLGLWSTLSDSVGNFWRELVGISDTWEVRVWSMFEWLTQMVAKFIEILDAIKPTVLEFLSDLQNSVGVVFDMIVGSAKFLWDEFMSLFGPLFSWIWDSIKGNGFQWGQLFTYIAAWLALVVAGAKISIASLVGGVKIVSVAIVAGWMAVFNGLKLLLAAFLSPIESAVNGVIWGVRKIQEVMGKTQTDFVSFATDMGKSAIEWIGQSISDGSGAIDAAVWEMMGKIGNTQSEVSGQLSQLGKNFGSSFTQSAIPALKDTKVAIDKLAPSLWGTKKHIEDIGKKAEEVANKIESMFTSLTSKIETQKWKVEEVKKQYDSLKAKLKEVGEQWVKDLAKIDEQLDKQAKKIADIYSGWAWEIGARAIKMEEELKKNTEDRKAVQDEYTKLQADSLSMTQDERAQKERELIAKQDELTTAQKKLEAELQLAKATITSKDMAEARVEAGKSETQLIIDRTVKKLDDAEQERQEIVKTRNEKLASIALEKIEVQKQMDEKLVLLAREKREYGSLIAERMTLDATYFNAFGKQIEFQIGKTKEAIQLVNELSAKSWVSKASADVSGQRAVGGSVDSGRTYLVGENWPELFSPNRSGKIIPNGAISWGSTVVNISLGGVVVQDKTDIDRLVSRLSDEFARRMELYKIGIS